MKIYAVAETVPESSPYLTAGKRYALVPDKWGCDENGLNGDNGFAFISDRGQINYGLWHDSHHLEGGNWTRIEEEAE